MTTVVMSFVLAMLVSSEQVPVFAFIGEFDTLEKCEHAIETLEAPAEDKRKMGCLRIDRQVMGATI